MRNRVGIMLALVTVLVAMFATAAYAATFIGDQDSDTFNETENADEMFGRAGSDNLNAFQFAGDRDELYGQRGPEDFLDAQDGDGQDLLAGGRGNNDTCVGDPRDNFKGCENIFVGGGGAGV